MPRAPKDPSAPKKARTPRKKSEIPPESADESPKSSKPEAPIAAAESTPRINTAEDTSLNVPPPQGRSVRSASD